MVKRTKDFVAGKEYARKKYAEKIIELKELVDDFSGRLWRLEASKKKLVNVLNNTFPK